MTRRNKLLGTTAMPDIGAEAPKIEDDLNGAIGAASGESAIEPEPAPEAPEIQPTGSFPSIADAYADMSEPPPIPPVRTFG